MPEAYRVPCVIHALDMSPVDDISFMAAQKALGQALFQIVQRIIKRMLPPGEAESLLLRITRNCPWNKCKFCDVYKHKPFQTRSFSEIKEDISHILFDATGHTPIVIPVINKV